MKITPDAIEIAEAIASDQLLAGVIDTDSTGRRFRAHFREREEMES